MEHFGITTVEAMSAGAVPVAYGVAGPLEAFDHGVEGFHFHTIDELVRSTGRLLADPPARRRLALAAIEKAEGFGMEAFEQRVNDHVDAVLGAPSSRRP